MATYSVKQGESFSDFVLNSCGNITAWEDCLNVNFLSTWTPILYNGQVLQIPASTNTNLGNIVELAQYPANNFSVPDIFDQITALFLFLETAPPVNIPIGSLPTLDMNIYYQVRPTETVGDTILNGSGDIENWDVISSSNFWDTWTPDLFAGEKVIIPSTANMNLNNFRALNTYPANNNSVPDVYEQINIIFAILSGDLWVVRTGFWDDITGFWIDSDFWIDGD